MEPGQKKLSRAAWAVLGWTIATILWGAYVRATVSGNGCGAHWPLCNGELVPHAAQTKTLVELSHRISSGIDLLLIFALAIAARRVWPRGSNVRKASAFSALFVASEALIGAGLVLFELVAHDASMKRALSMTLHLTNTFLLLGALTLTAYFASGGRPVRPRGWLAWLALGTLVGMILLGMSGAVTALGDTLFPPRTLSEGLAQDASMTAHIFLRLRIYHPIIAITVGALIFFIATAAPILRPARSTRMLGRSLLVLFGAQVLLGLTNVALLAPVWLQLMHLLLADAVWICLVLLSATSLAEASEPARASSVARASA